MPHWRALSVAPQREWYVEHALKRLDIETCIPQFKRRLHRPGSPWIIRPLFQGYLFADLDAVSFGLVRRLRWVIDILGTIPIPETVIQELQMAAQSIQDGQGRLSLIPGHLYRLSRSRLPSDILVRLLEVDNHGRAIVGLRLFGSERVVHVQCHDLEEQ